METKKRVIILGATGSVGQTVLQEIAAFPDQFEVVGVSCNRDVLHVQEIAEKFSVPSVSIVDVAAQKQVTMRDRKIFYGLAGLTQLIQEVDFDVLVVAISGINGLKPTLRAIEKGKEIILASKEILVEAGEMVMTRAREKGVKVLPLDSEHNAIFQCTRGDNRSIAKLQLTASGGCFWNEPIEVMQQVSLEQILQHPKWSMGKKITVDSSSMANKALEIIEAMHLFQVHPDQIEVLIHPDCVVHSLVGFTDGSFLAQLSPVSMRYAARFCLFYPDRCRIEALVESVKNFTGEKNINNTKNDIKNTPIEILLDLSKLASLHFYKPDLEKFPCLKLGFQVARGSQSLQIAYNAANEVAVALVLEKKLAFCQIPVVIEETLNVIEHKNYKTLEEILAVDQMVRSIAKRFAKKYLLDC